MHIDSIVAGLLTTAYAVSARHGTAPASLTARVPFGVDLAEVRVRLAGRLAARFGFAVEVLVVAGEGAPEVTSVELAPAVDQG